MLEVRENDDTATVEFTLDGEISREEFDKVTASIEAAIARHGKIRLLEEVRSFGGMDPSIIWPDLKFGLAHLNDFSRCAIVTDKGWIKSMATFASAFLPCPVRIFALEDIAAARQWLGEDG